MRSRAASRLTRREWIKATGAACVTASFGSVASCGDDDGAALVCIDEPDGGMPTIEAALATFEVTATSAILCAGDLDERVFVRIEAVDGCNFVRRATIEPIGKVGSTTVEGLTPGTRHRWRLERGSDTSGWATFTTAPPSTESAGLRFLFSADVGPYSADRYDVFSIMAGHAPLFYLSLGDWPYVDADPAATTLAELRDKHREARASAEVRDFLRGVPVVAIYDDHDVRDNWDGADAPAIVEAAVQAWTEWFPQRQSVRYRRLSYGALADVFVLDTRYHRSANSAPDDATKTILGGEQRAWLEREALASTAPFLFFVTSVPFTIPVSVDDWSGFSGDRVFLRELIDAVGPRRVTLLSADRHFFAASEHANGFREYQVGPLAAGLGNRPGVLPGEVMASRVERNYGEIEIVPGPPRKMIFRCWLASGELLYQHHTVIEPE